MTTTTVTGVPIAVGTDMSGYTGVTYPAYSLSMDYVGEPLATLTERTSASGINVRVQQLPDWPAPVIDQSPGAWSPAPWCSPVGQTRVAMTYGSAISVGQGPRFGDLPDGIAVAAFVGGYADDNPFTVVVAQVDASVAAVSATFGSGGTDATTPENGFAVLAVPTAREPPTAQPGMFTPILPDFIVTLERLDGTHAEFSNVELMSRPGGDEWLQSCIPPTTLPPLREPPPDATSLAVPPTAQG